MTLFQFKKKFIESRVGDEMVQFWPISLTVFYAQKDNLMKLRDLIAPFLSVKSPLAGFAGQTVEERTLADGTQEKITTIMPASDEFMARTQQVGQDAWQRAIGSLLSDEMRDTVVDCLMDSMRNVCQRHRIGVAAERELFLADLDLPLLVDMLRGFLAVNVKVFGPLGDRIAEAIRRKLEAKLESLASETPEPLPETSSSSEASTSQSPQLAIVPPDVEA